MPLITSGSNASFTVPAGYTIDVNCPGGWVQLEFPTGTKVFEGNPAGQTFGPYTGGTAKLTSVQGPIYYEVIPGASGGVAFDPSSVAVGSRSFGNAIAALGDSITANSSGGSGIYTTQGERSWAQQAAFQSGRKFFVSSTSGTGGARTDQIIASNLPAILNNVDFNTGASVVKPAYCAVLAGTNDVSQGVANSVILGNLQNIYDQLLAKGIIPVACTLTPRTDLIPGVMKLNYAIAELARQYKIPLADFWSVCVDSSTGGWLSGYNADTVHPNGAGAYAMGTELARALSFLPSRTIPFLYDGTGVTWSNSLFRTGTSGTPTGWSFDFAGSNCTPTQGTDAAVAGQALTLTAAGTGAGFALRGPSTGLSVTPGNWVAFMFRLNFAPAGSSPKFDVFIRKAPYDGTNLIGGLQTGTTTVPSTGGWVDYMQVFKIPSGVTSLYAEVNVQGLASVLKLGQFAAIDLTANGIVPA